MDEHSFDEFIKGKVGDYEDPSYDEGAFAALDKRLTYFQRISWYKKYRTEVLVIGALTLFTMLNAFITMSLVRQRDDDNNVAQQAHVIIGKKNVDSLMVIIHNLGVKNETLANELKYFKSKNAERNFASSGYEASRSHSNVTNQYGSRRDANDGKVLLAQERSNDRESRMPAPYYHADDYSITTPATELNQINTRPIVFYASVFKSSNRSPKENIHNKNVSARVKNDLEKHYFAGVGLNIAPHLDGVLNVFNGSSPQLTPRAGITADWVVSPRISIETSVDYMATKLVLNDHFERCDLPDRNDYWGPTEKAAISTRTLSSPVSLKYRQWISPRNELIVRTTLSPYFALNQKTVTDYRGDSYSGNDDSSVSKIERNEVMSYYTTTAKLSLGIQHLLKERRKLEGSLFYERSLQEIHHNNQMQLYGISLSYWYNVR